MYFQQRILFACTISLCLFSDVLDGYIARKMKCISARGALLDSLGDLLTLSSMIFGVYQFENVFFMDRVYWIIASLILFVLVILLGLYRYGKPSSFHTVLSKVTAVFLGVFFIVLFFFKPNTILFYFAISFCILSQVEEIILIVIYPEWKNDVKGIFWVLKRIRAGK